MADRTPAPVPAEVLEAARRAWSSMPWRTVVAVAYAAGVAAGRKQAAEHILPGSDRNEKEVTT